MGDDRYCYLHAADFMSANALADEDDKLGWDLPDDEIEVPLHLLPPYQDEEHDNLLPSASHPSYPYGNPYTRLPPLSTSTSSSRTAQPAPPPLSLLPIQSSGPSLATTLPALQLRSLYALTTFGNLQERRWNEFGLEGLLKERPEEGDEVEVGASQRKEEGAEGGPPTGQNAGMEVESEEEGIDPEGQMGEQE